MTLILDVLMHSSSIMKHKHYRLMPQLVSGLFDTVCLIIMKLICQFLRLSLLETKKKTQIVLKSTCYIWQPLSLHKR